MPLVLLHSFARWLHTKKTKGTVLYAKLIELYVKYGYYKEHLVSITKKGMDGQQQIADMMEKFRNDPPKMFKWHCRNGITGL